MAAECFEIGLDGVKMPTKDMIIADLSEFSNVFASEFNKADIHDRVLCFQVIKEGLEGSDEGGIQSHHRKLRRRWVRVRCTPTKDKGKHKTD